MLEQVFLILIIDATEFSVSAHHLFYVRPVPTCLQEQEYCQNSDWNYPKWCDVVCFKMLERFNIRQEVSGTQWPFRKTGTRI